MLETRVNDRKTNRILVVDDEVNHLKSIERHLQEREYLLEFAQNGEEALKSVLSFDPDLVLLDVMMPGMDGYEVCRRIKRERRTTAPVVILVTAKSQIEDRLAGYRAAADDYIVKPYNPEELCEKIRIHLQNKNSRHELRTANQSLEELVEAIGRKLALKEPRAFIGQQVLGFVHNLKSPLTTTRGYLQMARRESNKLLKRIHENTDGLNEIAETICCLIDDSLKGNDRVMLLIHNLLAKSKNEAGSGDQPIDLNDLIQKEIEFLSADLTFKHEIEVKFDLDPTIPPFPGIYLDFSQVISNLVQNAADAMADSPIKALFISTRHDEQHVRIEIRDTGPGIPPENLKRIFEPFFTTKAGKPDAADAGGTGLGLYTCELLMKSYGAVIDVQSKIGEGAAFTVVIPKQS